MYETMRNLFLTGLGAAMLTKDKVLELTKHLVEQGKLSRAEAERMAEDLVVESRRQARNLGEMLEQGVGKAVEALNLASRSELQALEARVTNLEQSLILLQARPPQAAPDAPEPTA